MIYRDTVKYMHVTFALTLRQWSGAADASPPTHPASEAGFSSSRPGRAAPARVAQRHPRYACLDPSTRAAPPALRLGQQRAGSRAAEQDNPLGLQQQ